jgi:hypothetical protein
MQTLERIAYDGGRRALTDQETFVAGIQQRTGTLLAAHALVASFLGATTLREHGLSVPAWVALVSLGLGLVIAAILLFPWRLRFAVDARSIHARLQAQATTEARSGGLGWLANAGYAHQELQEENATRVRQMSWLSGALAVLIICQTAAWLMALVVA